MSTSRSRGFTLIEVLVSIFLLSVLSAFCYATLNYVGKSRENAKAAFDRTRELQLAIHTLVTDFEQIEPRAVRDVLGQNRLPVLKADRSTTELAAFTRGGWPNPAGLQRGTLQRVTYSLENGTLMRGYTTVLDATLSNTPVRRELLKDVVQVQLRFMDPSRTWIDQWPALSGGGGATNAVAVETRPLAVEITLELRDFGRIVRVVEVPG